MDTSVLCGRTNFFTVLLQDIAFCRSGKTMDQSTYAQEMKRIRDYVLESEPAETGSVMIAGSEIENFIKKHEAAGGIEINDGIWEQITSL